MKKLTGLFGAALLAASPLAYASPIYYEVDNLGGDRWQYHYTLGNDTDAPIDWFTIFFDPELYAFETEGEEVVPVTYSGAIDWDVFVAAPELLFPGSSDNQPGIYDACLSGDECLVSNGAVAPGELVSGFSMIFTWLGTGTPGSQAFTLGREWLPTDLRTERMGGDPVVVSESGSLGLLGASIVLFGFGRRALARG